MTSLDVEQRLKRRIQILKMLNEKTFINTQEMSNILGYTKAEINGTLTYLRKQKIVNYVVGQKEEGCPKYWYIIKNKELEIRRNQIIQALRQLIQGRRYDGTKTIAEMAEILQEDKKTILKVLETMNLYGLVGFEIKKDKTGKKVKYWYSHVAD